MRLFALASAHPQRLAPVALALLALAGLPAFAQNDPPDQAGRVSSITGTVSVQPAGSDDWGQVYPNLPLGPGDRLFTDQDGRVEIQIGQTYLRVGPNTDITLVNESPETINFGIAQGAVHVRSFGLWQGQNIDLSTPSGDARLDQAGEFRVDVLPDQGAAIFSSFANGLDITGAAGFAQPMGNWQSLELAGTNPVYPQWLQLNGPDSLDSWSQQRDRQILNAVSYRYLSPEVAGGADLDAYGQWVPDTDYGPVWFPGNVEAGWQPYRNGHWLNRDPWGWVWVEDEPWGYAPFHYGRWISYRGRWGWVPGPREQHPVWSPALVVFAGGIHFGAVGVSAWFPLGPGEPYRPWYPCSPRYIDRVNISNIHESRVIHVQTTYVNVVNVTNITYVNRNIGATAMRQEDFAAGRPVRQAVVAVDAHQFDRVQVIDRPAPVTRQSFIARPVAHPVHVTEMHPTFINQRGMQITARPGAQPQPAPVRPAPPTRPLPGRTVVAAPPGSRFQPPAGNQPAPANNGLRPQPPNQGKQEAYPNQSPAGNPHPPVAPGLQPSARPLPPTSGQREVTPPPANNRVTPPPSRPAPPEVNQPQQRPNPPAPAREPAPRENVQPPPRPVPPPAAQPGNRPSQPPPDRANKPENKPNKDDKKDQKKDEKKDHN